MALETVIKGAGVNGDAYAQVDPTHKALRVAQRPIEFAPTNGVLGGHYAVGGMTGLIAAGITTLSEVFHVRWVDTARMFALQKLIVQFSTATGFAATTLGAPVELIVGHGSSANGSGGTALTPTSTFNKLRNNMAASAFVSGGRIGIATTGALTAATAQTLESTAIASCMGADNRTLVTTSPFPLFDMQDEGDHPLILQAGDTLAIRVVNAAGTGTWYMSVLMKWMELASY